MRGDAGGGKGERWQGAGKVVVEKGQVRGQVLLAHKDHECGGRGR